MYVSTGRRGRNGVDAAGGAVTTTGNISATSLTATGAVSADTITATSNANPPTSDSDTDSSHVAMHCAGGMSVSGLLWSNALQTTTHFTVSDERTKRGIEPLDGKNSADFLRALNPVSYVIQSTGDATVGFVAQDVEKLDPRLVAVTAHGQRSLDYRGISVHAVSALQGMQKELDEMRATVRALEQETRAKEQDKTGHKEQETGSKEQGNMEQGTRKHGSMETWKHGNKEQRNQGTRTKEQDPVAVMSNMKH
jgi:hypothetical protein